MHTREPVTFMLGGNKLFGVIDRPVNPGTYPGVLIAHGLLGSKDQPHRILVELSEALVRQGIMTLRFDLPGRGDSEGNTLDMTWQNDLEAMQAALAALATYTDQLAVLGMSWGGLLAGALAGREPQVKATVLWSSVPESQLDWRPQFGLFEGREAAENFAMLIGKGFYDGLPSFQPLEEARKSQNPYLLVYGTQDDFVQPAAVDVFRQSVGHCDVIAIEGADHIFFTYAWTQQVIGETVSWLAAKLM